MRSAMVAGKPRSVETRTMVELAWRDGVGQAALVRRGEVSPVELVEAALGRIERLEPQLHAITALLAGEALAAAASPDLPDGPFRGVPLLLKDLAVRQVGVPHWQGVPVLAACVGEAGKAGFGDAL